MPFINNRTEKREIATGSLSFAFFVYELMTKREEHVLLLVSIAQSERKILDAHTECWTLTHIRNCSPSNSPISILHEECKMKTSEILIKHKAWTGGMKPAHECTCTLSNQCLCGMTDRCMDNYNVPCGYSSYQKINMI